MEDKDATLAGLQAQLCAAEAAAEQALREKAQLQLANDRLSRELEALQSRLDFAEALVGPTEAQRKLFQNKLAAAREATLQVARSCPKSISTRCLGRLDDCWLRSKGLTDAEAAMLQRGRIFDEGGVPCEVSLLGDPAFHPYDRETLKPNWEAKGGLLQMSLGDVREKWGEDVSLEVLRCAVELDKHDASRRLGTELPWNETENREMEVSEVICLLGQQLAARPATGDYAHETEDGDSDWAGSAPSEVPCPEEWNGDSQAWSMLEAMMNDLGFDQTTLIAGTTGRIGQQLAGDDDDKTDADIVAEALEEKSLTEMEEETAAEQDMQNMQPKTATCRWLTPSGTQTPFSGGSSPVTGSTETSSFAGCGADPPAMPPETPNNDALLLQILQDDVSGNLSYLLAPPDSPPCPPTSL